MPAGAGAAKPGALELHGWALARQEVFPVDVAAASAGDADAAAGARVWLRGDLEAKRRAGPVRLVGSIRLDASDGDDIGAVAFDPLDRRRRRSPLALRELVARFTLRPLLELEVGRFALGWGKTDGWSPSDSFLPRDLTDPFADEKLPLAGARLRGQRGELRYEAVAVPITTPWRLPPLGGRYTPVDVPGARAAEGEGEPPWPGFGAVRLLATRGPWDLGASVRFGFRPAPILVPRPDRVVVEEDGTLVVPLDRRWAHEAALGVEASRLVGAWVLRAEAAPVWSDDDDLGRALLLAGGVERGFHGGTLLVTVAGNALDERLPPALLLDRSFLPGAIVAWTGDHGWGSYRLVWTQAFRDGDALAKLEVTYRLDDRWSTVTGADLPLGPTTGPLGALREARRGRLAILRSW